MLKDVNGSWSRWLPYIFMLLAALSRWPGLFPPNFSVFYGLFFCAGAFFPRTVKWWLPMGTLVVTDVALNLYYGAFSAMQLTTYVAFGGILLFGSRFSARSSFLKLLSGGVLGAVLFWFITNTAAWLFNPFANPEYTKDLMGWLTALTKGTGGYPTTLEFFIRTLMSGGLFTGLFAGVMKLTEAPEPVTEKKAEEEPADEGEPDAAPEEARA